MRRIMFWGAKTSNGSVILTVFTKAGKDVCVERRIKDCPASKNERARNIVVRIMVMLVSGVSCQSMRTILDLLFCSISEKCFTVQYVQS